MQGVAGSFYGTTQAGGNNGGGTVCKITPAGELTTVYSFCSQTNSTDGELPQAILVQGTDGNLYGTTETGRAYQRCFVGFCASVFKVTPRGELTVLQSFDGHDGSSPIAGLFQGTDGNLYGTTSLGGTPSVWRHGLRLIGWPWPIRQVDERFRQTGAHWRHSRTGSYRSQRRFSERHPASFTVVSDTFIRAVVPPGSTTGFVTVEPQTARSRATCLSASYRDD